MGFFRIFNPNLLKPLYLRNLLFHHRTATRPFSSQIRLFTPQKPLILARKGLTFRWQYTDTSPKSDGNIPEDVVHVRNPDDSQISADKAIQNANPNSSPSAKSLSASSSDAIADDNDDDLKTSERDDFDAVGESTGLQVGHLPEELSKNVVFLECESTAESGTCHVYLVGTIHVSEESCREVQAVIRYLKPQAVFLELCLDRAAVLSPPKNLQVLTMSEMIDMWRKKKKPLFGILYCWFLAKVAAELGVLPGSEFRVAYEEAMSYGAKVFLGDRPIQITYRRTSGKISLWLVAKFLFTILYRAISLPSCEDLNFNKMVNKLLKEMDDVDGVTHNMIEEMSRKFPTLMETLVYERDL